jgi:nitroreductase
VGYSGPDVDTVRAAIELAVRAPSVRNSQPWRWKRTEKSLQLFAGRDRQVRETDPDGCDLLLSCGAVLDHIRVAFASMGWQTWVRRLPDFDEPELLATIRFSRSKATGEEVGLAKAISARRSDRRKFARTPLVKSDVAKLIGRVEGMGVLVCEADEEDSRDHLLRAIADTDRMRLAGHAYLLELLEWDPARVAEPVETPADDREPVLLVLGTRKDDRLSRLRVGEAVSSVLLNATSRGLASCVLTEPLGFRDVRLVVRSKQLDGAHPQAVIRVGYPLAGAAPLPATPRRAIDEMLQDVGDATI